LPDFLLACPFVLAGAAVKIVCRLKWTAKEAGATDQDPTLTPEEIVRQWHEQSPHLRYCKLHHGWVYKAKACVRCPECEKVIEE